MAQRHDLVELAHAFGAPTLGCCILSEGNVSCRADAGAFWIKGSGLALSNITSGGLVEVRSRTLLAALDAPNPGEPEVRELLNAARIDPHARHVPSAEAFMHALLLELEGVNFVAHGHPTALLGLLCVAGAEDMARMRFFPDHVVFCGPESAFVAYEKPGLPLAKAIRTSVQEYEQRWGTPPKTIWLQNHGLVCLGATPMDVLAAAEMTVKAAMVTIEALSTGQPLVSLDDVSVRQVCDWSDEHYRHRLLTA
jgi:rhamnose utilization protein RhaD (predicted bifunctional aldolase and dehydrogenase)